VIGDRQIFDLEQQIAKTALATQAIRSLDAATFGKELRDETWSRSVAG